MVPGFATLQEKPDAGEDEVAVWSGDAWELRPDFRGHEYWLDDGSHHAITLIGVELPEGALDQKPPIARDVQHAAALARVNQEHARYLGC